MSEVDPLLLSVTAPGSPFEIGLRASLRGGLRQFVNAPDDLSQLIEAARRHGPKTFIVDRAGDAERRLTYDETFALRDALAAELGIARGDRVAICMRNGAEWMIGFLAVIRMGGVAVLVNSRGAAGELVAAIDEVKPTLVLADAERATLLRQGGFAGRMIEADAFPGPGPGPGAMPPPVAPALADDPCAILFTSGTTGRVKGAVLSHRNLITGLLSVQLSGVMILHGMAQSLGLPVEALTANMPQQAVLLVYPLFHISGLGSAFLSPLFSGSKVVIMRRWDAREALRLIEAEGVTMFTGVPTMLWDVLNAAAPGDPALAGLRNVASGGQALPVNLLDAMHEACPQAAMGTGYGMTECAGSVAQAVGADFLRNRASAGRVLPLVDMKIASPDGAELPRGQTGEITVRGAMVMQGYWNRPEDTAAVLSPDGWLRTGDVGYVDAEGYVFIVDRKKDMVISGGENIYCAEVERVMGELPGISECAAFGIPDERLGEVVVAVVVAEGIDEAAIIHAVGERLARYKAPARVAFSNKTLPRNHVGKVDKIALRQAWPQLNGVS